MPTWYHMFNSTLIGAARVWFDELPSESIDSYKDLKAAFLAYFMQQNKYVKDPVEIHNIKQKDGETIEDFMERFKVETERMKGAPECMWIFEFMHEFNNPELTKRLNEYVSKTMEEMMITTTAFIRGEVVATGKKKDHTSWRTQDQSKRHTSGKRKVPAATNYGNPSRKEKQQQGYDQSKVGKKEAPAKDKSMTIYMIQSWQRMTRQKVTQSFERVREITFPLVATISGTEGPLVIEVEIGGHLIHRIETIWPRGTTQALGNNKRRRSFYKSMDEFHDCKDTAGIEFGLNWKNQYFGPLVDTGKLHEIPHSYHNKENLLAESDEEKMAFHTSQGVYCYTKMPFGLKNASATYQRLVDNAFDIQIGRNIEVYIDDLVIKSHTEAKMLRDIGETFSSNNEAEYEALIASLRIAAQMGVHYVHVLVEILKEKSMQKKEVTTVVEEDGPTWMTPIIEYLKERTLPGDRKEASKLCIKARRMHAGPRSVVAKAIRLGYYWPTMHRDARDMIRACNDCQIHCPVSKYPQQPLTPITALWPFYKWGIDIAGPFLEGPTKVKFLIVAMDYFTKWIEAKAMATITGNQAHRTMIKPSHGDTPFSLTYETKAVIPAEIGMPTYRTATVDVVHNDEELWLNLDLPGDFVYPSNDASHAVDGRKLGSKWEGPYEVREALGYGAYKLRSADGTVLPKTWNIANLKKCYH
nr:reverse transcriptase domain-containing protein [Tanacetum cinerariifolium]